MFSYIQIIVLTYKDPLRKDGRPMEKQMQSFPLHPQDELWNQPHGADLKANRVQNNTLNILGGDKHLRYISTLHFNSPLNTSLS